ncbi:hypothetical protein B0H34DRAFT_155289 [Crassisporium funariophilum]|nr:hypothetical protein B0H34DRAFT_155289 [Crassisporium funariophilum]
MDEGSLQWVGQHKIYWSTAALSALFWDAIIGMEDEYEYIWKSPPITNKWIYLTSRYIGTFTQLANHVMIVSEVSGPHTTERRCRFRIRYEITTSLLLFGLVEIILMLRVYALYNKNRTVALALMFWFLAEFTMAGYFVWQGAALIQFNSSCTILKVPFNAIGYMFMLIVPIYYLVVRDGSLLFAVICSIFLFSIPYTIIRRQIGIIIPFMSATLSIAACRITLNLQSMPRRPCPEASQTHMELTTVPQSGFSGALVTERNTGKSHPETV